MLSLPLPRSVGHATQAWCQRFIEASRAYVADAVPIEIVVQCGRVDAALEMARIPRRSEDVVANLVRVARAMTKERLAPERIDDVWLEAIANATDSRDGALARLVEAADFGRPRVREALRQRASLERDDLPGAAVRAWLLVRDTAQPEKQRAAIVDQVTRILAHDDRYETQHRAAAHAALWLHATMHGHDAIVHRAAVPAAAEDESSKLLWYGPLLTTAMAESGEMKLPAPSEPSVSEAEAALAEGEEKYEDGLIDASEREALRIALFTARLRVGDVARVRRDLAALMVEAKDRCTSQSSEAHDWVLAVRRGAHPALPVDESWFAPGATERLDDMRVKWKADYGANPHRLGLPARKILLAARAYAQRGDVTTARQLIADAAPNLDRPPRRAAAALATALIAIGDIDRGPTLVEEVDSCEAEDAASFVASLALAGRGEEALALFDRTFADKWSGFQVMPFSRAVLALSTSPGVTAQLLLDAWSDADAAQNALVAAV